MGEKKGEKEGGEHTTAMARTLVALLQSYGQLIYKT